MSEHGKQREEQVRALAARLGVADFVYFAPQVARGAATREPSGDGLLLVGGRGAILQVKARDPEKVAVDSPEKGRNWAKKNGENAVSQGVGSRKELARRWKEGRPLVVTPVRALDLDPEVVKKYQRTVATDTSTWPTIVIVDHPGANGFDPGPMPGAVWFTFQDWQALQLRIRSVTGTLKYVDRILEGGPHVPLGAEGRRYRTLQAADVEYAAAAGRRSSRPFLVDEHDFDKQGADLFHDVIDHVWPHDGIIPWRDADEYRAIVEFLDAVPPTLQATTGSWFLRKRAEIEAGRSQASGMSVVDNERLIYACTHARTWSQESWGLEVADLATLRHVQAVESGASKESRTLGVGAWVHPKGVAYTYVLMGGKQHVPQPRRTQLEVRYLVWHEREQGIRPLGVTGKKPCPCGSRKRFGRCCGVDRESIIPAPRR
jgi:hypothetical protein